MSIPESQLETWSHKGATTTAKRTHESIRNALVANSSPVRDKVTSGDTNVNLQGSYRNSTNIRGDSDVDIVVHLNTSFGRDLSALSESQKQLYRQAYSGATYLWEDFRRDVLDALRSYYRGAAVTEGRKSLKVAGSSGRLNADVVPTIQFRKYESFYGVSNQSYHEGIRFHDRVDGRMIVNYPKIHYDNGVAKNSEARTNGWYKHTLRIFKNVRSYLADNGIISRDLAPSYFVECLLYNVPDTAYGQSRQTTFVSVIEWLRNHVPLSVMMCQNEHVPLFGDTPEQWSVTSAAAFVDAATNLWNTWY